MQSQNAKRDFVPANGFLFSGSISAILFSKQDVMSLGDDLQKKINKKFEPSTKIPLRYKGYDLVLITDKDGNAVQLFMGKAAEDGSIKGERYARTLKYNREGQLIKDYWERKGKAT